MATILPGSPPGFDRGDVSGTVKAVCEYLWLLQEYVGYLLGQNQKGLSAGQAGLRGLSGRVADTESELGGLRGGLGAAQGAVSTLSAKAEDLEHMVSSLNDRLASMETRIEELEQKITQGTTE